MQGHTDAMPAVDPENHVELDDIWLVPGVADIDISSRIRNHGKTVLGRLLEGMTPEEVAAAAKQEDELGKTDDHPETWSRVQTGEHSQPLLLLCELPAPPPCVLEVSTDLRQMSDAMPQQCYGSSRWSCVSVSCRDSSLFVSYILDTARTSAPILAMRYLAAARPHAWSPNPCP